MSVVSWLNRPGPARWIWRPGYEFFYAGLKTGVAIIGGMLFRVRRVGPRAHLHKGGVIVCANHSSYLDPAFVQLCVRRRVTCVMTNDFYKSIYGRWFFKLVGAIPVGRGRLARRGLYRSMAAVRRGHAVVVFPEGRLSLDGTVGPGQRGVSILARRTGAPVHPVAIAGAMDAWPKGRGHPARAHVRLAFGRPLHYPTGPGSDDRATERQFIEGVMDEIRSLKAWVEATAPAPKSRHSARRRLQDP